MADAGYADGFKLTILAQPAAPYQRMVTVLADILRRNLKIDATLNLKDAAELPKMRAAGDYQIYVAAGLPFQDDPDEYMGYFKTGGVDNFIKYSNPEADKLWEQQSQAMDPVKRQQLVQQIERLVLADMPVIPLHKHKNGTAYWPFIKGFTQSTLGPPTTTWERLWLDK